MDLLQKMKHAERRNMLEETCFFCISASILYILYVLDFIKRQTGQSGASIPVMHLTQLFC